MNTESEQITYDNYIKLIKNMSDYKNTDNKYRYYYCYLTWQNTLTCNKIKGPVSMPNNQWTKLISIESYIPECLDEDIIKYKWIPDRVIIRDKST
jgi:hypothetical protein